MCPSYSLDVFTKALDQASAPDRPVTVIYVPGHPGTVTALGFVNGQLKAAMPVSLPEVSAHTELLRNRPDKPFAQGCRIFNGSQLGFPPEKVAPLVIVEAFASTVSPASSAIGARHMILGSRCDDDHSGQQFCDTVRSFKKSTSDCNSRGPQ